MIMWECTTGCKPFANVEHDGKLICDIINGKRPVITSDTPERFANLMKRCWEFDPKKRPSIAEVYKTFRLWYFINENAEEFDKAEADRLFSIKLKLLGPEFTKKQHSKAVYTSRSLKSLISNASPINSMSKSCNDEGITFNNLKFY